MKKENLTVNFENINEASDEEKMAYVKKIVERNLGETSKIELLWAVKYLLNNAALKNGFAEDDKNDEAETGKSDRKARK